MKIIIDTNIIFSGLLNSNGTIGDIIFNSDNLFEFYSCSYMRYEIEKHWNKLKKISTLSDAQLNESQFRVFSKIHFINEELIPKKIWLQSEEIAKKFDIDDSAFIALTKHLHGFLWTGDKVLYNELRKINFKHVYTTGDLVSLRKVKTGK